MEFFSTSLAVSENIFVEEDSFFEKHQLKEKKKYLNTPVLKTVWKVEVNLDS